MFYGIYVFQAVDLMLYIINFFVFNLKMQVQKVQNLQFC
jgi:hypothetical protein